MKLSRRLALLALGLLAARSASAHPAWGIDAAGNLYGEHLVYEPEGERWKLGFWKLTPDGAGRVLVADFDHSRVLEIGPGNRVRERWKSDRSWSPTGVAVSGGVLYVLESRTEASTLLGRMAAYARVWRVGADGKKERLAVLGE